jgi:phage shock protein A
MFANDPGLALVSSRMTALHEDITEMKLVLRELTAAITKLALIEQQQAQAAHAQERAFKSLEKVEQRVSELERRMPEFSRSSAWVDRAVWATAAASLVMLFKKSGFL